MSINEIYLDTAATTKPNKSVIKAMMPYFTEKWYNPSSLYTDSVNIAKDIKNARETIAKHINAKDDEIIFTNSGSEANCLAIQGWVKNRIKHGVIPCIVTGAMEHHSILACVDALKKEGIEVHYVKAKKDGIYDKASLDKILDSIPLKKDILVSLQWVNNEIGTIQHINSLSKLIHQYGAYFHVDAVQALDHLKIDVNYQNIDMMSLSGHKIGAPKGIGCLYKKRNVTIEPLIYGTQEFGLRGGTENVPYIMGFKKAIELLDDRQNHNEKYIYPTMFYFFVEMFEKMGCKINGSKTSRIPSNINVTLPEGIMGESLIYMMDVDGIKISSGSACNSHSQSVSHVLKAIGLSEEEAVRTIRITLPENILGKDIREIETEFNKAIKLLSIDK